MAEINATFITDVETWNSGGGCMIDLVHLQSGMVIAITEEVMQVFLSMEDFMADDSHAKAIATIM